MANKEKLDVEKVISEYCMLKSVLKNKYAMDVVSGKVEPAGPSAAADKRTLQAMQRYVKTLDNLVVVDNGLSQETLDDYFKRISEIVKSADAQRPESKRQNYTENAFDDGYRFFVKDVLNTENAGETIEKAILANKPVLDSVNSLVVNLGGKRQGSYVKLLCQSTELFSSVSGLEGQIKTLEATKGSNDQELLRLRGLLSERKAQAKAYKATCNKLIDELGSESSVLGVMLKETNQSLDGVIKKEAEQTRAFVANEATRVIEDSHTKDKIKAVLISNTKKYPRYVAVLSGTQLSDKGLRNLYAEVKSAAKVVGFAEDDPAVDRFYNDLAEENIKNTAKMNKVVVASTRKKKIVTGIVAGVLIAGIFGGVGFGIGKAMTSQPPTVTSVYEQEYKEYSQNEYAELDQFKLQLDDAIKNNEIGVFTVTPTQVALKESINNFSKTDNIEKFKWSSTGMMESLNDNALTTVKANYYQTNYEEVVERANALEGQVANLTAQLEKANEKIKDLTSQLGDAHTEIDSLKSEIAKLKNDVHTCKETIANLESQIKSLQSLLDAANADNAQLRNQIADLQNKLDIANEKVSGLEKQVSDLTKENADLTKENSELKQKVAEYETKIGELEGKVDNLTSEVDRLKSENSILSSEKADLLLQIADLKAEIARLNEKIAGLENGSEVAKLQEQVKDLQDKLTKAENEVSRLQEENKQLTQEIVDLRNSMSDLENTISELNKTIESLKSENASLKEANAKLEAQVADLTEKLTKAVNDYNTLKDAYEELLKKGPVSQEEYEKLQQELNDAYNKISGYEELIVKLYNGLTRESTDKSQAAQDLEKLMKMFGIDYKETDAPSNENSEYQP